MNILAVGVVYDLLLMRLGEMLQPSQPKPDWRDPPRLVAAGWLSEAIFAGYHYMLEYHYQQRTLRVTPSLVALDPAVFWAKPGASPGGATDLVELAERVLDGLLY